jgi:hypothetical protein
LHNLTLKTMKKYYFLVAFFALTIASVNAQFPLDDLESWTDGSPVFGGHWTSWSGTNADAGVASSTQAHSGGLSYYVDGGGVVDGVLDLGNFIFGEWFLNFWAYVPTAKMGYFNVQAGVPIIPSWCGEIYFNRDNTNPGGGEVIGFNSFTFTFPHDQWFLVEMHWDISFGLSLATWEMKVDGIVVVPLGTPYVDTTGATPVGLGGLDIFSAHSTNEFYVDDIIYSAIDVTGIEDLEAKGFSAYPNPVKDVLNLKAKENITSVSIYNILGQQIFSSEINALTTQIDMSAYESGIYIIKALIGDTEGAVKVIK